jgi:outer membrane lipoprotein carrier protein
MGKPIMKMLLAAVLVASGVAAASQPAAQPAAAEIAVQVQQKYDRVRDFSADFEHEAESGVLRKTLLERGSVLVKKPGKMRWTYKAPEQKVFVSDGVKMYMHTPADNQVIVSAVPTDDEATTAVLFLSGKGDITRDFTVTLAEGAPLGAYALRLEPKLQQRDYDWLQITVDRSTFQIRSLTTADKQGTRSTFRFSNFKENVGVADKTFAFSIPRGADVIQAGSNGR